MPQHLQPWYPGDPIVAKQWGNYSFNVTALRTVTPILVRYGTALLSLGPQPPPTWRVTTILEKSATLNHQRHP